MKASIPSDPHEWHKDTFRISTDKNELNLDFIHSFLLRSYWGKDIPRERVERAIDHSLCFGLFDGDKPIGFGRVITDYCILAYVADVFVLEEYQGKGLGFWFMEKMMDHPDLESVKNWELKTVDAQEFYRKLGFTEFPHPEYSMVKKMFAAYADLNGHRLPV